jgi:hypothetical protein
MAHQTNQGRKLKLLDWAEANAQRKPDEAPAAARLMDHVTSRLPITIEEFRRRRAAGNA